MKWRSRRSRLRLPAALGQVFKTIYPSSKSSILLQPTPPHPCSELPCFPIMILSVFYIAVFVERSGRIMISYCITIQSPAVSTFGNGKCFHCGFRYYALWLRCFYSLLLLRPVLRDFQRIRTRLPPDQLLLHRQTHLFRAPCCFCASLNEFGDEYIETKIYVASQGKYSGEYIAECALKYCGYLGRWNLSSLISCGADCIFNII